MSSTRPTTDAIAEGLLRQGTELSLTGRGRSMWPVIAPGDRVVARRGERPPVPGDIVVIRTLSGLITHRIVGLLADPPRYVTRGDWLEKDDAPVAQDAVLAIVHRIVKRGVALDLEAPPGALAHKALYWAARVLRRPPIRAAGRRLKRLFG